MGKLPLISVILPVYNGEKYLAESIDSILNQTYRNFEFIIINDGSTDNSEQIIKSYTDSNIYYYINKKNIGTAATLNKGINLSRGELIARMDQDDISEITRFERQVSFLRKNQDCAMVGTWAQVISNDKDSKTNKTPPEDNNLLQLDLIFNNPFIHSSIMIRQEVFEKSRGYCTDEQRTPPEDYELWSRMAKKYKFANIPEFLHTYRIVETGMCQTAGAAFREKEEIYVSEMLYSYLNNNGFSKQMCCLISKMIISRNITLFTKENYALINSALKLIIRHISANSYRDEIALNNYIKKYTNKFYILYLKNNFPKIKVITYRILYSLGLIKL